MAYDANSIKVKDFRDATRSSPGMYLGADGTDAIFNCFLEILNNSCDEAIMGRGNRIEVELENDTITVIDTGAGIPRGSNKDCDEVLIELMCSAHSSGKFDNENYSRVRGCHGCGQGAVCMCSDSFEIWSRREGSEWYLKFIDGIPQDIKARPIRKTKETGTTVKFVPSREVFHIPQEQCCFDANRIENELELTSFFIPGVTFIFRYNGEEKKFLSKNGLKDFAASRIKNPLHRNYIYNTKHFDGNIDIEVFAQWTEGKEQCYVFSNGALNSGGGTPVSGMKAAFTRTINDLAKKDFSGDTIRKGLVTIINIKHPHPIYQNQVKDKIQNMELRGYTQSVFTEAIKDWATKNPNDFNKIIGMLAQETKIIAAEEKVRQAILNNEREIQAASRKKFSAPIKLMDCEKHGQDSILYITEGRSAKTPVQNARNIEYEAVYDIRGKIIGALKNSVDKVLENEEVKDILQILGCGIFEKYNSSKLNFGKLLIFSDKDPDGAAISNLIVTLIYVLCPNFIKEGRLGRVIPPLYRLKKGKKAVYFYSREEYEAEKDNYPGWDSTYYKGVGECSSEDMKNTMFNEKNRKVLIYKAEDFGQFSDLLQLLMGEDVPARRQYIFDNIDFHKLKCE